MHSEDKLDLMLLNTLNDSNVIWSTSGKSSSHLQPSFCTNQLQIWPGIGTPSLRRSLDLLSYFFMVFNYFSSSTGSNFISDLLSSLYILFRWNKLSKHMSVKGRHQSSNIALFQPWLGFQVVLSSRWCTIYRASMHKQYHRIWIFCLG